VHNLEVQYLRKDHTPIHVSLTTSPVRDGEGKLVGVLRIMADISDRLRAQMQLQREAHAFHQTANSSPDWVVRFDTKLRFIYANTSIATAMGFVPATFLGKTAGELGISEALTAAWEEALTDVLRTGLPREIPLTYAQRQEVWHYTCQIIPELDRNATIKSLLCIAKLHKHQTFPPFRDTNPREELLTSALLLRYYAEGRRNFAGANLRGVKLSHAILPSIDLSGAYLNGADLNHTNLENACLRGVDLRGANLQGAILWGADLRGADLKGADVRDIQGLDIHAL
jgi:PAS domain-containing protein